MKEGDAAIQEVLPLPLARQVDELCCRFEDAWKAGSRPTIEDYLAEVPEPGRRVLQGELIALEIAYRDRAGEAPQVEEYAARFSALDRTALANLFATLPPAKAAANTAPGPANTPSPETPLPSGGTRLRCPHCHNPIQLRDDQVDEVLCPCCGSSFRIRETRHTTTTSPMRRLGKFQLLERVGLGAFGAVWRARDCELDRTVALKIPHAGLLTSPEELERFHREARAAAQLRHPGIVTVHEVVLLEGLPTIVADFIEGVPLKDFLEAQPLTFREAAALLADVAEAVDYAHDMGLVHRDLKPANIMIEYGVPPGEEGAVPAAKRAAEGSRIGKPLVMDFGLASRQAAEVTMTLEGQIVGTPAYMSPEQAAGKGHGADRRSDVYSLGVILYELLSGELPFRGSRAMLLHQVLWEEPRPLRRLNDKIPRDLETICLKALAKAPAGRYATARDMADDLRRFLKGELIQARPVSQRERAWHWCRRNPKVASLTGLAVLLLIVVAVGSAVSTLLIWRQIDQTNAEKLRAEENLDTAYRVLDEIYLDWVEKHLPQQDALAPEDRQFLERAVSFYERFALQRGADPSARQKTALAYLRVANIQMQLGQIPDSRGNFDKALALFDRLVAEFPDHPDYRHNLACCHSDMAHLTSHYFESDQEKIRALRQAAALLEKLTNEFPDNAAYQRDLAESYRRLCPPLANTERQDEAEMIIRHAIAILSKLAKEQPTEFIYRLNLVRCQGSLGELLVHHADHLEEAEKILRSSLEDRKKLVHDYPRLPGPRLDLGWGYNFLARCGEKTGKQEESKEHYHQAAAVFAKLVDDFPGVLSFRRNLAESQLNLAGLCKQMRLFKEAEQACKDAIIIGMNLVRDHPAVPRLQEDLVGTHMMLAELYQAAGQPKEAEEANKQVVRLSDEAVSPYLRMAHALSLARLKEHTRATAEAAILVQTENTNADVLYDGACVYALSAAAAGNDSEQAEHYAAQAVELLRRAFAKGWEAPTPAYMKQDTDLDFLRQRNDYRKLLSELEEKQGTEKQLHAP